MNASDKQRFGEHIALLANLLFLAIVGLCIFLCLFICHGCAVELSRAPGEATRSIPTPLPPRKAELSIVPSPQPISPVSPCPAEVIPVIPMPDLGAIGGYKKIKPGKQEITVGKPYGVFFPGKEFDALEYRHALRSGYARHLAEQIEEHNRKMEEWRNATHE
ncbi:MAG: hypothetical protein WC654_00835 [Patescibacteria group bacterium]